MRNKMLRRLTAFLVAGAMIFGFVQLNQKYLRAEDGTSVSDSAGVTDPSVPPTDPVAPPTDPATEVPPTDPVAPPTDPVTEAPPTTTLAPEPTAAPTEALTTPPTEPTAPTTPPTEPTAPTTPPTEPTAAPSAAPTAAPPTATTIPPTTVAQKPVQQFSLGQVLTTGTSNITVEVTKVWQDLPAGTNPGSVTVELRKHSDDSLVKSGTLTQANGYSITWADIPAVSDPAAAYYLREILPSGYVQVSLLEVNQVLTLDSRVTPNNISYANYPKLSFFIMKPTANNPFIVWTLSAMTEADRVALLATVQAAPDAGPFGKVKDDYLAGKVDFIWLSGPLASYDFAPTDPLKGYLSVNFTIDPVTGFVTNYNIDFQEPSNWTQYMFGSYSPLKYQITNKPYTATGSWAPSVTKELAGKALANDMFEFELRLDGVLKQTVKNTAAGAIPFSPLTFNYADVGSHTVTIVEKPTALPGVTSDPMTVTYNLNVLDNGDGTLAMNVANPPADTIFNNSYAATGIFTFTVRKELSGRALKAGEFSFELKEGSTVLQTVSNLADGSIPFLAIHYTLADVGTHYYTISEKIPVPAGVTHDPMVIEYAVTVSDLGNGQLRSVSALPFDTTFNNSYETSGSFTPQVMKQLSGLALAKDAFSFELKEGDTVLQTVKNLADGTIPFAAINYTLSGVGTHTYTITEKTPVPAGVTHDPLVVTYVVTVSDNGDGTLDVSYDIPADTIFNNLYTAEPVDADIEGTKVLEGRDLADGEFSFELYMSDSEGNVASGAMPIQTVSNVGGTWKFTLTYGQGEEGTYYYMVREVAGSLGGVTYDTSEFLFRVDVTDDGVGHMVADVMAPEGGAEFNNLYEAEGSFLPVVTKVLEGRVLEDGNFTFELTEGLTLLQSVTNKADGSIPFVAIPYTLADVGTHTYTIRELPSGLPAVLDDPMIVTFVVTVSDNGDGTLSVEYDVPEDTEFNNRVNVLSDLEAYYTPEVKKDIQGTEANNIPFTFELRALSEGAPLPDGTMGDVATLTGTGSGIFRFDMITFTEVGTYVYEVKEVNSGAPGYTYDQTKYILTIKVELKEDLTQEALLRYLVLDVNFSVGETPAEEMLFTNLYNAEGSFLPEVTKELEGRPLAADEFTFTLTHNGEVLQTVKNLADGKIPFLAIPYTMADVGVHTYEIRELPSGLAAILDDPMVVTYVVTVADKGDGTLDVSYEVPDDTIFNNRLNVLADLEVYYTPEVVKVVTGKDAPLTEFTFELRPISEGAPMPEGSMDGMAVVKGKGAGTFAFGEILFTEEGTYVYEITEKNGGAKDYTYDKAKYTLTIVVTKDETTSQEAVTEFLTLETVITKDGGTETHETMTFTNKYYKVPETGESIWMYVLGGGLVLLGGALFLILNRRNKKNPSEEQ